MVDPPTKKNLKFGENNCNNFGEGVKYEGEVLGEILEKRMKVKVHYQNEMFTTKMAQANLIEK